MLSRGKVLLALALENVNSGNINNNSENEHSNLKTAKGKFLIFYIKCAFNDFFIHYSVI